MSDLWDGPHQEPMNPDNAAALDALHRASVVARRRALGISGYVLIGKDGKIVRESDPKMLFPDGMGDELTPRP